MSSVSTLECPRPRPPSFLSQIFSSLAVLNLHHGFECAVCTHDKFLSPVIWAPHRELRTDPTALMTCPCLAKESLTSGPLSVRVALTEYHKWLAEATTLFSFSSGREKSQIKTLSGPLPLKAVSYPSFM